MSTRASLAIAASLLLTTACDSTLFEEAFIGTPSNGRCPSSSASPLTPTSVDGGVVCLSSGLCSEPLRSTGHYAWPHETLDLVFVAEGFQAGELPKFDQRVDELMNEMLADEDSVVSAVAPHINVHRLQFTSATSELTNEVTSDTALGGCLANDSLGGPPLLGGASSAGIIARALVPHADAVIVLFNTRWGRDHAGDTVQLKMTSSADTLTHELGHALLGLADEYSDVAASYPPAEQPEYPEAVDLAMTPNLSLDPSGAKWSALVNGSVEGGSRYSTGVYHPAHRCRMSSEADPFCPVCREAVNRLARAHRGLNDGPPRCAFSSSEPQPLHPNTPVLLRWRCEDENGFRSVRVWLDDEAELNTVPSLPWARYLENARVAVGVTVTTSSPGSAGIGGLGTPTRRLAAGHHVLRVVATDKLGVVNVADFDFDVADDS